MGRFAAFDIGAEDVGVRRGFESCASMGLISRDKKSGSHLRLTLWDYYLITQLRRWWNYKGEVAIWDDVEEHRRRSGECDIEITRVVRLSTSMNGEESGKLLGHVDTRFGCCGAVGSRFLRGSMLSCSFFHLAPSSLLDNTTNSDTPRRRNATTATPWLR